MSPDTLRSKYLDAYALLIANLLEDNAALKAEAASSDCVEELSEIKDDILHFLETERGIISTMKSPALDAYLGVEAPGAPL